MRKLFIFNLNNMYLCDCLFCKYEYNEQAFTVNDDSANGHM